MIQLQCEKVNRYGMNSTAGNESNMLCNGIIWAAGLFFFWSRSKDRAVGNETFYIFQTIKQKEKIKAGCCTQRQLMV